MRSPLRKLIVVAIQAFAASFALAQVGPANPATRPARAQQQVPVKDVVLFTSGVGYFEHFGTVQGNANAELSFKSAQINDILKSLLLEDMDGGKVSVVTYASQEPLERTLKSFEVDLNGNPPLAQILDQLRGSSVTASVAGGAPVSGQVLGVERKQRPAGEGKLVDVWVMNLLLGGGAIRPVDLEQVAEIKLDDPKLQQELVKALAAVAASRDQDKKPVTLRFNGQGQRRVRIGYVVEAPVWKASYRLVLSADAKNEDAGTAGRGDAEKDKGNEKGQNAQQGQAEQQKGDGGKLLGWAIVENQTDNDWEGVQLSLVSGRPISFIEDLYQPLYVPRPVVEPELYASLKPQTYAAGMEEERLGRKVAAAKTPQVLRQQSEAGQQGLFGGSAGGGERGRAIDATTSVQPIASGAKVGELFQYTVPDVSLPRQKSAMIPILSDDVRIRRLSIYNASVLDSNPLLGARLTNTTGKLLPYGPITVLDGGAYAGDANIDDLPSNQNSLLSYGIDQQVLVHSKEDQQETQIVTAKIVAGVMELTNKDQTTQTYVAQNKGKTGRTLMIEHSRHEGFRLVEPKSAAETTDSIYRFEQDLPAEKTLTLTVREEHISMEEIKILATESPALETYIKTGSIPQPVKDALTKVIQMKAAIVETQRQIQLDEQQITEVSQDQSRIRENMKTVAQNTDYYQKLLKKLDEQETTVEKLQADAKTMQQKQQQQQKQLEDYLAGLNVG